MHHKYDISLKDAFYIIDFAVGIFLEKFESQENRHICALTFPSHQPQFTISSGRWKNEPDGKEK